MKHKDDQFRLCGCTKDKMCGKHEPLWQKVMEAYQKVKSGEWNWTQWLEAVKKFKN